MPVLDLNDLVQKYTMLAGCPSLKESLVVVVYFVYYMINGNIKLERSNFLEILNLSPKPLFFSEFLIAAF